MNGHRAVAATMALLIVAGAGCSGSVPGRATHRPAASSASAHMSTCHPVVAVRRSEPTIWPSRVRLRESFVASISGQVVDPGAGTVYVLVSKTNTPVRGPWVLCRISLATGAVRPGMTFPADRLTMASPTGRCCG